jgi:CheY-like chemotaxis protein
MTNRIKVLIVDDSAVVRQVLTGVLSSDPQIQVIGAAADPIIAQGKNGARMAGCDRTGCGNAQDGWDYLPEKNHGRAADPGVDLFHPD